MKDAEVIAFVEKIHDDLGLDEPRYLDPAKVCAHFGLVWRYKPLDDEEAHLIWDGGPNAIAHIAERTRGGYKEGFSLLHELAHLLLHGQLAREIVCTNIGRANKSSPRHEIEADLFASTFLLPELMFAPLCDHEQPTLHDVSRLSDYFRASLSATGIRYTRFATSACAIVCTVDAHIKWWRKSASFGAMLEKGYRPGGAAFARLVFAGERPPDALLPVDPAAWGLAESRLDLHEHARKITRTSALSLLWHPS